MGTTLRGAVLVHYLIVSWDYCPVFLAQLSVSNPYSSHSPSWSQIWGKKKSPFWLWIAQRKNVKIPHMICRALNYLAPTFLSSLIGCLADTTSDLWHTELLAILISMSFHILSFAFAMHCLKYCKSLSLLANSYKFLQATPWENITSPSAGRHRCLTSVPSTL